MKRKYNSENRKGKPRGPYKKEVVDMASEFESLANSEDAGSIQDEPEVKKEIEEPMVKIDVEKVIDKVIEDSEVEPIREEPKQQPKEEIKPNTEGKEKLEDWMKEYETVTNEDQIAAAKIKNESEHAKFTRANPEGQKEKRKYTKRVKETIQYEEDESAIRDANAQLMNGAMLISLCDFFFPMGFDIIHKRVLKNPYAFHVKHKHVVLNEDQVASIEPVSDASARVIFAKVNPLVLFALGMSVMYGTNYKLAMDNVKEEFEKKGIDLEKEQANKEAAKKKTKKTKK